MVHLTNESCNRPAQEPLLQPGQRNFNCQICKYMHDTGERLARCHCTWIECRNPNCPSSKSNPGEAINRLSSRHCVPDKCQYFEGIDNNIEPEIKAQFLKERYNYNTNQDQPERFWCERFGAGTSTAACQVCMDIRNGEDTARIAWYFSYMRILGLSFACSARVKTDRHQLQKCCGRDEKEVSIYFCATKNQDVAPQDCEHCTIRQPQPFVESAKSC